MLAQTGITAIWDAHVAAAAAHGLGKPDIAIRLMEIAEAAEKLWLARTVKGLRSGDFLQWKAGPMFHDPALSSQRHGKQ